jgi:hypothetical protein
MREEREHAREAEEELFLQKATTDQELRDLQESYVWVTERMNNNMDRICELEEDLEQAQSLALLANAARNSPSPVVLEAAAAAAAAAAVPAAKPAGVARQSTQATISSYADDEFEDEDLYEFDAAPQAAPPPRASPRPAASAMGAGGAGAVLSSPLPSLSGSGMSASASAPNGVSSPE